MKTLVGDNSQIIPDFEEAKEEPVVVATKPQFAPKTAGLQGAQAQNLIKAAPVVVANIVASADPTKTASEVIGDSIAGAFDSLPGFEGSANSTSIAQKGITIEDTRKGGDQNLKSLIQSIVSTIEPALSALGSQNHAAVSVIIKDSDEKGSNAQVSTSEDPNIVHNDKSPPFFMIKAQQGNSTAIASPALQSSIVEAVSQATQNMPDAAKMDLNGKGFNVTLVVGNPQSAPTIAAPTSSTITLPAMPPGQKMSDEYMAAVAVSLQKTKELEEAQHQAAI